MVVILLLAIDIFHQILSSSRECLNLLMAGWCCGEKRFEEETMKTVNDMMTALNDPSLPLHELQVHRLIQLFLQPLIQRSSTFLFYVLFA